VRRLLKEETMAVSRKVQPVRFEVLVSFDGLDRGDVFTQDADEMGWALQHVETGYLRVVEEAADAGRGEVGQG
jgi:hypothetical protein